MATLSSTSGPEVNPAPSAAESPAPFISRRTCILILLALSSLMYLGTASSPALLDDADASHALVAREMLQRHDYVVMFLNGVRYLQKALSTTGWSPLSTPCWDRPSLPPACR